MDGALSLVAVVIGPAGIWFGWWLSERSERNRHDRASADAERQAELDRVGLILREARAFAGEARGFAYAVYARGAYRAGSMTQGERSADDANRAWRALETTLTECELLGPDWMAPAAQPFVDKGRECMGTLARLQQRFTAEDVTLIQEQLEQLDAAHAAMLEKARTELRP